MAFTSIPTPRKKPKIAIIGSRGIPATYGGVEKAVEELYAVLAEQGYEVVVYGRKYYLPDGLTEHRGMKVRQLYVPNIRGLEAFLHSFIATVMAMTSDADVLQFICQGPGLFTALPRWFTPRKKIGFLCQGIDWQRDKWGRIARTIIRAGEKATARYPHFHMGVSQYLCDHYHNTYGVAMANVPNGVRMPDVTPDPSVVEAMGLKPGRYVMFCGRLVPEKAIDHLIEAFLMLDMPDAQLAIVGDTAGTDDYTQQLRQTAASDPRIVFTGYQFGEAQQQIYANAAGYVTASKLEGLPLTLLEAMSYGLPVAVSNIGPHTEVTDRCPEASQVFVTGDRQGCCAAMQRLLTLNDEERILMQEATRGLVASQFSWQAVAEQTVAAMAMAV